MAIIRQLWPTDIKKVKELIEVIAPGSASELTNDGKFTFFPLELFHRLLPLKLKFLQESYVAVEKGEVLGLISIITDDKERSRFKINRLILNTNAYDAGKQLINYVVNKYGAAGVETFIATIDENHAEAIGLFKNACGFRSCSKIHIWENNQPEAPAEISANINFRNVKLNDAKELLELDRQSLHPQYRTSLEKNISDFKFGLRNRIINAFRGLKVHRLALEDKKTGQIEGYILLVTPDNNVFWSDITLSLAFQEYYPDVINYIVNFVKYRNCNAKLYIYDRKYYQANAKLGELLESMHFKIFQTYQVLAKDYWKATPVEAEKKSPIAVFPDITSPACNIIKL